MQFFAISQCTDNEISTWSSLYTTAEAAKAAVQAYVDETIADIADDDFEPEPEAVEWVDCSVPEMDYESWEATILGDTQISVVKAAVV